MVRVIPGHIEEGRVVPEHPLPANVRSVSILLELADETPKRTRESTLPRLLGLLKDVENPEKEYEEHLDQKYR